MVLVRGMRTYSENKRHGVGKAAARYGTGGHGGLKCIDTVRI